MKKEEISELVKCYKDIKNEDTKNLIKYAINNQYGQDKQIEDCIFDDYLPVNSLVMLNRLKELLGNFNSKTRPIMYYFDPYKTKKLMWLLLEQVGIYSEEKFSKIVIENKDKIDVLKLIDEIIDILHHFNTNCLVNLMSNEKIRENLTIISSMINIVKDFDSFRFWLNLKDFAPFRECNYICNECQAKIKGSDIGGINNDNKVVCISCYKKVNKK